ncbi:MAG TPA: T9SS type A sorting domain-containing protein [Candidatus Acidoferrum sp.]|nr:T9SS type A sorting domain-containing protein [Candidatus Acidoferrum sp.]
MKKLIVTALCVAALTGGLATGAAAQTIMPTPFWTSFFDSTSTVNGHAIPAGTIIQAYTKSGILCGQDTAKQPGYFGFMPVYGDDPNTPVVEGAVANDTIQFKINGRSATVMTGDPTWTDQTTKRVQLSTAALVALTVVHYPDNGAANINDTVDFVITVRNDGNGLDFYGLHVTETKDTSLWKIIVPSQPVYANPGQTVDVKFSIATPNFFPGNDTLDHINYTIFSEVDTTVRADSAVNLYASITGIDDPHGTLPNSFVLNQNYPNPFNPTTTISFSLPTNSEVSLEVFDILGRTVERRDLGVLSAGEHQLEYDASQLASGMYLYRVSTAISSQTKKMMLVK